MDLGVCSLSQILTRDARGKSEIIFDFRTCAGLSSGRVRLQHQDIQSFRCSVHGCRKSCGTCSNDDNVAQLGLIDRIIEAEAFSELFIGRIPKDQLASTDDHRHVVYGNVKTIQQRLDAGVSVEINVRIRVVISCQKFFDAKRARRMSRAEQHGISVATSNQLHAPENERTHNNLAQLAVGLHKAQQLFPLELDQLAGFPHVYLNHCPASGQHTGFSCELTRTKSGDKFFVSPRRANNLQTPSSDDEETRILRACFDKDVANLNRMDAAMAGYALDLFRLQYREHPLRSRGHTCQSDWRIGMRHC